MMDPRLDNYDWGEAFGFAGEEGHCNGGTPLLAAPAGDPSGDRPADPFAREDVAEIIAMHHDGSDEPTLTGVFRLRDGRFAYLSAGCDFTGWD